MRRIPTLELLDDDRGSPKDLATGFDDLWRINRLLGGISGSLQLLDRFLSRTGLRSTTILDAGAGDGRMAQELKRRLIRRGVQARFVALDRRISHLRMNSPNAFSPIRIAADVQSLPFEAASFDAVTCNLFLHHFSGPTAQDMLSSLLAVAREAVLVNDLERKRFPYWFIRGALWFTRSPITRHDGPASVRQAYTRAELHELATKTGAASFEVVPLAFYRLGLILWKNLASPNG